MLSQSFTFSILDYSFEEHPIKIIEDVIWQLTYSFQVHHHFASLTSCQSASNYPK